MRPATEKIPVSLHTPLHALIRILPQQHDALEKLKLQTLEDILYYFPVRYGNVSDMRTIASLGKGDTAVIFGKISNLETGKGFRKKIPMGKAVVEDATGKISIVWFNQPYLAKMIPEGAFVRVEGKVSERKSGGFSMNNPKIEKVDTVPQAVGDSLFGSQAKDEHTLYPVYPETRGVTSNWIYHAIQRIFKSGILDTLIDPVPASILEKYNLPSLQSAIVWIHTPKNERDALSARKRFSFEEILLIQLERQKLKRQYARESAYIIEPKEDLVADFIKRFPFEPTKAQVDAIHSVFSDFKRGHPMSRLLEGDVGSGKTAVAAATAFATVVSRPRGQSFGNLQVAYMAPTEILAKQHFENFIKYFEYIGVSVGLITGSGCRKFPSKVNPKSWTTISRAQLCKWVANGEIPILIGTHALIQKTVKFKDLAYVIIDEQHRFGINQRKKLAQKGTVVPHLLSMSATPIPRTLALTIYGDLDLTILDQMPAGRKPIITEIVLPTERKAVYEKIRTELQSGRQAYVICPRIDEPDPTKELALQAKSAKAEAVRLKKEVFPEYEIGVLHSKMKPQEKEDVMAEFSSGKTNILVATSVVEVGVNVPNATVIILEGAERFGLSQLHQLRGRVIRSNDQAYCYVFSESSGEKTRDRLHALKTAKNGFELAEYDLKLRGPGTLSGSGQWGVSDIGMEALQNLKMVEAARAEATALLDHDETLAHVPLLMNRIEHRSLDEIHME